jgi:hypothetical protein
MTLTPCIEPRDPQPLDGRVVLMTGGMTRKMQYA